ncbi:hypothetical protein D3C72_818420 [compost metagenome]
MLAAGRGLQDDVGDDRIALHVDAGGAAADQFDALDLGGDGAAQDVGAGVVLGRRARAVDQDVADRAFKAAGAVAVVDREARHAVDHVQRRIGAGVGEEVRREDQDAGVAGLGQLARRRRSGFGGQGRRGGGDRQRGGGGQQNGLGHGVVLSLGRGERFGGGRLKSPVTSLTGGLNRGQHYRLVRLQSG